MIGLITFLLLDLLTIVALAYYFGVGWAVLVVLALSAGGVVLCRWARRKLRRSIRSYSAKDLGIQPQELSLLENYEIRGTAMLTLMFIFPGVLSDLFAFFMLLPKFGNDYYPLLVKNLKSEGQKQGKTFEQMVIWQCCGRKD